MNQLAPILKQGRTKKNWTQDQVTTATGIARKTYSTYESGSREPDFENLVKLIKALDIAQEVWQLLSEQSVPRVTAIFSSVHQEAPRQLNLEDVAQGLLELHAAVQKIAGKSVELKGVASAGSAVKTIHKDISSDKGKSRKARTGRA